MNRLAYIVMLGILAACGGNKPLTEEQKTKTKEVVASFNRALTFRTATPLLRDEKNEMHNRLSRCEFKGSTETIAVSGSQCPVSIERGVENSKAEGQSVSKVRLVYAVKDAEYAKLNDVNHFDISHTSYFTENRTTQNIKGKITSQKHGEIQVEGSAQSEGNPNAGLAGLDLKIEFKFHFKDFSVQLRQEKKKNEADKYYVQDVEVSESEFGQYSSSKL